jgi:GT2 family glycosyltransferase
MQESVGIVVPTLGTRPDLLRECLKSIREAGDCFICIVIPNPKLVREDLDKTLWDTIIEDPGLGLAQAINCGIYSLPASVEYCNWLGDDDLLGCKSLDRLRKILIQSNDVVLVYGNCEYIDTKGSKIWRNASGQIAARIIGFGPCLIPQPGSLFRRRAFESVGGLNPAYGWAFDYDLFIRLSKVGKLKYLNSDLASFRWHSDSLTVGQRKKSVEEASMVRLINYSTPMRLFAPIWEPIVKFFTLHAPKIFEKK